MRDVCFKKIIINTKNTEKIGGRVKVVEMDETVVLRRINNGRRIFPIVWLVGGIVKQKEL
jgi:hypothetical protein